MNDCSLLCHINDNKVIPAQLAAIFGWGKRVENSFEGEVEHRWGRTRQGVINLRSIYNDKGPGCRAF
jgi:hypothetical protein